MAYNYLTDFVGLWRATTGGVEKGEMPGLDFVVAALGRAGILNLVISGSPPVVNQDTTAWFKPSVSPPDYAAEGVLYLWDGTQYVPATPDLFFQFLVNSTTIGTFLTIYAVTGVPSNSIGVNGDYALRIDAPGGIYGPKAGGSWPIEPLPGTSYSQISAFLDFLGSTQGEVVFRGASGWAVLAPGTVGEVLTTGGAGANPSWAAGFVLNSAAVDAAFGSTQGDILYRNATVWTVLAPGTNGYVLTTGGAGANPAWAAASSFTLNSAAVDAAFGATPGGVLVRGAAWANSGAGSAGQVLTSNGAAAATFQSATAVIDAAFGGTQGSILYRNATVWTALAPGTAGQVLQTAGVGANPLWGNPATSAPGPGAIGSYAIGEGFPADSAGAPYAGTWVAISGFIPTGSATTMFLFLRIA